MTLPWRARAALWAVFALGASAGAPLLGRPFDGDGRTALVFTPKAFDFGEVRAGVLVRAEFAFVNGSDSPIRIVSAHGTCGCVQAQVSATFIEPKGTGTIRAMLFTEGRQGPQTLGIRVRTDEGEGTGVRLALNGTIRVALRPRPPHVHLGAVAPGSEHHAEISVEKLDPVREVRIEPPGDGISVEKLREDERGCTLKITVQVPWKTGTQPNGLRITGGQGSTWIPVVWTVERPFELSTNEIELVGKKAEITARPRWPSVRLARVDTHGYPLTVVRDGDRIAFTLTGSMFDIPSGAMIHLVPEPESLGRVAVPVTVRPD